MRLNGQLSHFFVAYRNFSSMGIHHGQLVSVSFVVAANLNNPIFDRLRLVVIAFGLASNVFSLFKRGSEFDFVEVLEFK